MKKTSLITRLRKQNEVYKSTVDVQNNKITDMDKKIDQQNESYYIWLGRFSHNNLYDYHHKFASGILHIFYSN